MPEISKQIKNINQISKQIENINQIFISRYIKALKDKGQQDISEKLKNIFQFQKQKDKNWEEFLKDEFNVNNINSFNDFENNKSLIETMDHYAKINDILRRLRTVANQQYFDQNYQDKAADSFVYVLKKIAEKNVSLQNAQKYLNRVKFSPSLTAHPTNPCSVEYTKKAMELTAAICEGKDIDVILWQIVDESISGDKKTQEKEIEEGIAYLDSIYDSIDLEYEMIEKAIKEGPEKYRELKIPNNINQISVWMAGDGDGNPMATEESLLHNVKQFRKRIKEKYKEEMENIRLNYHGFDLDEAKDPQVFIEFLNAQKDENNKTKINNLIRKVETFGFHYAKIDIRHEANDIMKVVVGMLKHVGAIDSDVNIKNITKEKIQECFNNSGVMQKLAEIDVKDPQLKFAENDELIKRIFGRFQVVAKNPEMFEKIIIAEFKEPKHAAAVMLMLKASRNKFAEKDAHLNIVPLAESVDDLQKLPEDIKTMLRDDQYLEHIKETKKIYFMIAKSDTVRRNGVGAQFSQEKAVRESIKTIIETLIEKGINDLENYEIISFNGGGQALQRGGGRITELPSVYGRYALKSVKELQGNWTKQDEAYKKVSLIKISDPCLTTQGHQNYILYQKGDVGAGTLSAFAAQAFYAEARKDGEIPDTEIDKEALRRICQNISDDEIEKKYKEVDTKIDEISKTAMACFSDGIGTEESKKDTPIVKLFQNGPWVSVMLNNKSSRPSKRGGAQNGGAETILNLRGGEVKNNSLLKQRAIGVEKICAHSRTYLVSWFGWGEALEQYKAKGESLHELYCLSKSFRDQMRSAAFSLSMVDFKVAWAMMCGRDRPNSSELKRLQEEYKNKITSNPDEITKEETLAFIEEEYLKTKKLVGEAIIDKDLSLIDDFDILSPFPEVEKELEDRKENCGFAEFVQAKISNIANSADGLNHHVSDSLKKLFEKSYCANDVAVNAPISAMLSMTKASKFNGHENHDVSSADLLSMALDARRDSDDIRKKSDPDFVPLLDNMIIKYQTPDSEVKSASRTIMQLDGTSDTVSLA